MWETGTPTEEGRYLCAWKMGDGYLYGVGTWTGGEWFTSMSAEPNTYQAITGPDQQDKMLDELHKNK